MERDSKWNRVFAINAFLANFCYTLLVVTLWKQIDYVNFQALF